MLNVQSGGVSQEKGHASTRLPRLVLKLLEILCETPIICLPFRQTMKLLYCDIFDFITFLVSICSELSNFVST